MVGIFPFTIPHSIRRAAAPVVIAAAALVPVIVPYPVGYIPLTDTPGETKSGDILANLVGPHDDDIYKLPSSALYAPQVIVLSAAAG